MTCTWVCSVPAAAGGAILVRGLAAPTAKFSPSLTWFKRGAAAEPPPSRFVWSQLSSVDRSPSSRCYPRIARTARRWDNFLTTLPHPEGLKPFFTGDWVLRCQPGYGWAYVRYSSGRVVVILTFLGGFHPQTQSLWLTDMAHHHLAIAVIFIIAGHQYRTNFDWS